MPSRHENVQKAVDREVHQDHYHTTVQPVQDREVRPEVHHHQVAPVQEKKVSHEDHDLTKRKIAQEASQFRNTQTVHETKHTATAAPTVEGERVHHHVHETIQPVVHKETITPEVVHTTVPVHETHHAGAKHHGTSVLPVKHMSDFKSTGGSITGGTTADHAYDGCPKPHGHLSEAARAGGDAKAHLPTPQTVHGSDDLRTGVEPWHAPSTQSQPKKASLIDRINPMKDSDGDGQKGFMK